MEANDRGEVRNLIEDRWIFHGANMLAQQLLRDVQNPECPLSFNKKNFIYLLKFLMSDQWNMESYVFGYDEMKFEIVPGRKTEWRPVRIWPIVEGANNGEYEEG